MRILVTGGTGFLGQHLAMALLQRGHAVSLLGRNFASVQPLLALGGVPLACDLRDHATVHAACAGMDVVYHVGALSAPWGKRADFFAVNVDGTAAVLAGCRMHGVRRCIYVSSPSVLFSGHDQWNVSDEAAYPAHFTSVYALTKKRGEDLVRAATDLHTVILRPKAIFGPGDQTLLPRLIESARQRRLPQIGAGRNLVDLTYVENVVHALLLSLDSHVPSGRAYLITNNEHVPLWDVIRRVLDHLHLSTSLRRLPLPVVLSAASLMELRAALIGKEPLLTRYSALILARTQTYDISAAQRDLGYTPIISVEEGLERTLVALSVDGKSEGKGSLA